MEIGKKGFGMKHCTGWTEIRRDHWSKGRHSLEIVELSLPVFGVSKIASLRERSRS